MKPIEFGEFLKELRKKKKLTMRQLDTYSGVSHSYISQMERGERGVPSPEILKKLSKPLGVGYEDLMMAAGHLTPEESFDVIIGGQKRFMDFAENEENRNYKKGMVDEVKDLLKKEREFNELIQNIELKDEELLKKHKFFYEGQELSEEKTKQLLSFIRFLANEPDDK